MNTSKWVLFDLDGTLTQSEEGIWKCARHTLKTMGYPEPDEATLRKFIGPPLTWSFRNLAGMTEEQALQAQRIYRERYNTVGLFENRVYPGIRYALRCLKKAGFHLGVVTGKPELPTKRILDHFGLAMFFESVICATDNKADKEEMIRKSLPDSYDEAWMVGDRKFDMEGGRLAGIHTLGVTYGYGSEEELLESGAEKLAHLPREIAEILCPGMTGVTGAFLSMEGPDGSGKGTQLAKLQDTLNRFGSDHDPGAGRDAHRGEDPRNPAGPGKHRDDRRDGSAAVCFFQGTAGTGSDPTGSAGRKSSAVRPVCGFFGSLSGRRQADGD